ncbi:MAG: hypothetical protein NVSMB56_00640 [Pyrinomonadaceae bacterium]
MKKIRILTVGLVIGLAGLAYTADTSAKTKLNGKAKTAPTAKAKGMCPFCRAHLAKQ